MSDTIMLEYFGKKAAIKVYHPWMDCPPFVIKRNTPTQVNKRDALMLIEKYPEIFREELPEDELDKELRLAVEEEEKLKKEEEERLQAELDAATGSGDDSEQENETPDEELSQEELDAINGVEVDSVGFEVADGKYQCPFCEKSYNENGQGKSFLLKHLEKEHRKEWATALLKITAE